jgi:hypothetical protein
LARHASTPTRVSVQALLISSKPGGHPPLHILLPATSHFFHFLASASSLRPHDKTLMLLWGQDPLQHMATDMQIQGHMSVSVSLR